jgi:hypothetical protein
MRSRVVIPETRRLSISDGDWILVRKRLTHGETQEAFKRRYLSGVDGRLHVDPVQIGHAQILAYLVDWSLTDPDGAVIPIKGQGADLVEGALNSFDDDTVAEILAAIRQHEVDMYTARETEKKTIPTGVNASSPISISPAPAAGGTSGSVN